MIDQVIVVIYLIGILILGVRAGKDVSDIKQFSGACMCNGVRILQHFKHRLWNEKNAVVFVGYQVQGTLGRKIVDGAKKINIYGEDVIVKAKVHTINGFSAHADQNGLIDWMSKFKKLDKIFLIHGERDKQEIFQKEI